MSIQKSILEDDNLSEHKIKENWLSTDIQVSIICTAYNHELYIKNAIEGFLSQETNFAFEVIIHDDASIDETPNIIMDYHMRFPNIIIPILQKENQHSKGNRIFPTYINPIIRGKYIAHCEGDDFWIDSSKIQKQYEALEYNQNCDICFHPARADYPNGSSRIMCLYSKSEKFFPIGDVILGGGGFIPTASVFYRKEVRGSIDEFFEKYGKFPVGDVMLQFFASKRGGALYLPMIGSVYRVTSVGSWSSRMKNDSKFAFDIRKKVMIWNEKLNEFSNYEYEDYFNKKIMRILIGYIKNPYMEKDERIYFLQNYSSYLDKKAIIRCKILFLLGYLKKFAKKSLFKYLR